MCLVFIARGVFSDASTLVAFNRDEVYARGTLRAHWWSDAPILGGRDSERGGSWAGVTRDGRLALLTFVRQGESRRSPRSRGELVTNFLREPLDARAYLGLLRDHPGDYLGYNLVVGRLDGDLLHYSNVTNRVTAIGNGVHGLSNADLDTPWPKVVNGVRALEEAAKAGRLDVGSVFALMGNRERAADRDLPRTGVPLTREQTLSSMFISDTDYGTRSTTLITLDRSGGVRLVEKTHTTARWGAHEQEFAWTLERPA